MQSEDVWYHNEKVVFPEDLVDFTLRTWVRANGCFSVSLHCVPKSENQLFERKNYVPEKKT